MSKGKSFSEMLQAAPGASPLIELPAPIPLRVKPESKVVRFPIEKLTDTLKWAVEAIENKLQVPEELAAAAVLAACSHAAQTHADVINPIGQRSPLSLFMLSIAKPSDRKTSTDKLAMQATREHEKYLELNRNEEMKWHKFLHDGWFARRAKIMNSKLDNAEMQERLRENGLEPLEPLLPSLVCSAPTIEGLMSQFRLGQPSLALFNNDGGSFVGSYSMGKDFRLKTSSDLSSLWNAEPIDRTLKSESYRISNRRLALHLMVQPAIAKELFNVAEFRGQGFFSRFLITNPESRMGTRFQEDENKHTEGKLEYFKQKLLAVYRRMPTLVQGTRNELNPRALTLDEAAKEAWREYADYIEGKLGKHCEYAHISDFAGKIVEHALRIAGVMTIIENPDANNITKDMLVRAGMILEYYTGQYVDAFEEQEVDEHTHNAELLLDWLHNSYDDPEGRVSMTEIQHDGPNRLRATNVAVNAISMLVAYNYLLDNLPAGSTIRGKVKKTKVWSINPRYLG